MDNIYKYKADFQLEENNPPKTLRLMNLKNLLSSF